MVDRVYKEDLPAARRALEELREKFAGLDSATDWGKLRIEPLLEHVQSLERMLGSPAFALEASRLRKGVAMFRSDLVYLRENIKVLKTILASDDKFSHKASKAAARTRPKPRR